MLYNRELICEKLENAIEKSKDYIGMGEPASYIPELLNVDSDNFAFSLVTTNGDAFNFGDENIVFSIQSISKIVDLIIALTDNNPQDVYEKVGSEPTKYEFNSLVPIGDRAANPFINAGAITTTSMIFGRDNDERFERILNFYQTISDFKESKLMEDVFDSEMKTTDRNKAIAYYLKSKNIFTANPDEVLELYIKSCSISSDIEGLATMGAVLANKGYAVKNRDMLVPESIVQIVVSQMASCGMYENSGDYLMNVGIPSKSGVSGAIVGVVPGVCGLAVYSPRLDKTGNSVRGKELFKIISQDLGLNIFV
ncbi:Glutaminase [Anaerococcus prevotii]|uniref:Glutaminase n=1 Tax=Anaerococcus prevotii (strain ATCC 9321 / DSM 20548 / JCM 6508 / NCTC 11806 / PC1) TaxID=525919 RepID=C7RFU5_ANAPD|nr:glutaminase A [Anaerococcus prevotii]ACV28356.1 Glutaminase [Anaerococcus prevotii DSM 20548]SUU93911.1 Glutaminase [Anaerococcus prevotii]